MGFQHVLRWTQSRRPAPRLLLAAGLLWGLTTVPAARAVILTDGAWEAEVDLTRQAGLERWEGPLGVDQATQVWYWLSFGSSDRIPINAVGQLTTTLTDSNGDGDTDSLNAFYDGLNLDVTLNQRLHDGGVIGSAVEELLFASALTGVLTIANTSSDTFSDLSVWVYVDMELLGTPTDDAVGPYVELVGGSGPPVDFRMLQFDEASSGRRGAYEGDVEPALLQDLASNSLQLFGEGDGFMNFLNNVASDPGGQEGIATDGDLSALVSLTFDLAAGESIQLIHTQSLLTPVPEPSTALLLGLGMLGVALRRGRSSA